jgi:serine/threonine protein kinase
MADNASSLTARSRLSDFNSICKLGSGSFGTVYKVRRIVDNSIYVIKDVRIGELSFREQEEAINEVNILAGIDSPYIVGYCDSFIEDGSLHIVMEYCNRGDLQALVKKAKAKDISCLKEDVTWNLGLQVILGLYHLHEQHILHRDLKSANVFLKKDDSQKYFSVKIGDLGVAKLLETSTAFAQTIVGTPYYLSPELVKDEPYRDKSDCWALGVLLYECCTLKHPFEARNQCALIMKIIQAPVKPPPSNLVSTELSRLILWLLQKDPLKRPNIKEILCEDFIQSKLIEHGYEIPNDILKENATYELSNDPTINNSSSSSSITSHNRVHHDEEKKETGTINIEDKNISEDYTVRANRIYADDNMATVDNNKNINPFAAGGSSAVADAKDIDLVSRKRNDTKSTALDAVEVDNTPNSNGQITTTRASTGPKIARLPHRANPGSSQNNPVRGDRVRGGVKAVRTTSSRVLTRHQVQPTAVVTQETNSESDTNTNTNSVSSATTSSESNTMQVYANEEKYESNLSASKVESQAILTLSNSRKLKASDGNGNAAMTQHSNIIDSEVDECIGDTEGGDLYEPDFEERENNLYTDAKDSANDNNNDNDNSAKDASTPRSPRSERLSQDATINQQLRPQIQVQSQPQIVSRKNSGYSDGFESEDDTQAKVANHYHNNINNNDADRVEVEIDVKVVNGLNHEVKDDAADIPIAILHTKSDADSKGLPLNSQSNHTSHTSNHSTFDTVHTYLSDNSNRNSDSYANFNTNGGGDDAPNSPANAHLSVQLNAMSIIDNALDTALAAYDDDFEDYDDELDNLYEHQDGSSSFVGKITNTRTKKLTRTGEEEATTTHEDIDDNNEYDDDDGDDGDDGNGGALSAEYLAHFGGNKGDYSNRNVPSLAPSKENDDDDAPYMEDQFKASLRLNNSDSKNVGHLDVKGAYEHGDGDGENSENDISNGQMSNDSLEDANANDANDDQETQTQIEEMLYWIGDTRDILVQSLGKEIFTEIYNLCKNNMSVDDESNGDGNGDGAGNGHGLNPSSSKDSTYLHDIQKKLQEHLNASLEGVLGTVMQVKALLAWEDELARKNKSIDNNSNNINISSGKSDINEPNFLKAF